MRRVVVVGSQSAVLLNAVHGGRTMGGSRGGFLQYRWKWPRDKFLQLLSNRRANRPREYCESSVCAPACCAAGSRFPSPPSKTLAFSTRPLCSPVSFQKRTLSSGHQPIVSTDSSTDNLEAWERRRTFLFFRQREMTGGERRGVGEEINARSVEGRSGSRHLNK